VLTDSQRFFDGTDRSGLLSRDRSCRVGQRPFLLRQLPQENVSPRSITSMTEDARGHPSIRSPLLSLCRFLKPPKLDDLGEALDVAWHSTEFV